MQDFIHKGVRPAIAFRPQGDLSPRGIGRAVYRVGLAHISQAVV